MIQPSTTQAAQRQSVLWEKHIGTKPSVRASHRRFPRHLEDKESIHHLRTAKASRPAAERNSMRIQSCMVSRRLPSRRDEPAQDPATFCCCSAKATWPSGCGKAQPEPARRVAAACVGDGRAEEDVVSMLRATGRTTSTISPRVCHFSSCPFFGVSRPQVSRLRLLVLAAGKLE